MSDYAPPPPPGDVPPPPPPPPPGMPPVPASGAPTYTYADWPLRAQGWLIDFFGPWLVAILVSVFISDLLGWILWLGALGWGIYNGYLQGETGQSTGKKIAGIRLVREADGQLIGGGLGIGRFFLHILDAIPCYLGFLWPLWDAKRQTFADKIVTTVVIR